MKDLGERDVVRERVPGTEMWVTEGVAYDWKYLLLCVFQL